MCGRYTLSKEEHFRQMLELAGCVFDEFSIRQDDGLLVTSLNAISAGGRLGAPMTPRSIGVRREFLNFDGLD
jgi:hypothetical protein